MRTEGGATVLPSPLLGHFVKDFMKTVDILNISPPPAKFFRIFDFALKLAQINNPCPQSL